MARPRWAGRGISALVLVLIGIGLAVSIGRVVARHREWMIGVFANVLAIATVRLIGGPIDFVLVPYAIPLADRFVLAIWTSWLLTLAGAECWIRYTRPRIAQWA